MMLKTIPTRSGPTTLGAGSWPLPMWMPCPRPSPQSTATTTRQEGARSLGTFDILSLLASARERGLPHVYLGYYVAGCQSMEYKRKFRPNEVLRPDGTWEAFNVGYLENPPSGVERE